MKETRKSEKNLLNLICNVKGQFYLYISIIFLRKRICLSSLTSPKDKCCFQDTFNQGYYKWKKLFNSLKAIQLWKDGNKYTNYKYIRKLIILIPIKEVRLN